MWITSIYEETLPEIATVHNEVDPIFVQVNVTADHRIVYGADLAAFLQTFAKIIEDPESLTL